MNAPLRTRRVLTAALTVSLLSAPVLPELAPVASAAPGVVASTPVLSATVLTPGREIGLRGTENTRTLEGYRGLGGKTVNGRVLRSDNLSKLTAADAQKLRKRGVVTVVDLRTGIEKQLQPNKKVPGARTVSADVLGGVSPLQMVDLGQAYTSFVTDRHARAQFRTTLLQIKDTAARGGTTLYHCSAGKDRTGWTSAVLLSILGVDRKTIDADFLASNHYRHASSNDVLSGVNIAWLNSSFAAAKRKYGSMDGYVRKGLGLSAADVASLRANLLS